MYSSLLSCPVWAVSALAEVSYVGPVWCWVLSLSNSNYYTTVRCPVSSPNQHQYLVRHLCGYL